MLKPQAVVGVSANNFAKCLFIFKKKHAVGETPTAAGSPNPSGIHVKANLVKLILT
jgi:hypothetical protein